MNVETQSISLNNKLNSIFESIPTALKYYLFFFLSALLFFTFWVPANDFDTMTSYIARIKLEEFGNLRQVGTLELQYLFPKFFDYLHKPFLKLGYFMTLPSFALLVSLIFVIARYCPKKLALISLGLLFAAHPILIMANSMKNDLALGIFAFFAWFIISFLKNSRWYLFICVLSICCLIGTKWHGVILAFFLTVFLIYRLFTTHKPEKSAWLVLLLGSPLLFYVSSIQTYIDNFKYEGSFFPMPAYLQRAATLKLFAMDLYRFFITTLIETFDVPMGLLDHYFFHGKIWCFITNTLHSGKAYNYTLLHSSNFTSFGIILIFSLAASCYVAVKKEKFSMEIRVAALTALLYTLAILYTGGYSSWSNRYFITSYLLALIPFASVLASISFKHKWKIAFYFYLVAVTIHVLIGHQERRIFKMRHWIPGPVEITHKIDSLFTHINCREELYFHLFAGYLDVYNFMKKNISTNDSLLFINYHQGNDVPFIYPFIKDRNAANTSIISNRFNQTYDTTLKQWKFLFLFQGEITSPNYEKIYFFKPYEISIYKLIEKDI